MFREQFSLHQDVTYAKVSTYYKLRHICYIIYLHEAMREIFFGDVVFMKMNIHAIV